MSELINRAGLETTAANYRIAVEWKKDCDKEVKRYKEALLSYVDENIEGWEGKYFNLPADLRVETRITKVANWDKTALTLDVLNCLFDSGLSGMVEITLNPKLAPETFSKEQLSILKSINYGTLDGKTLAIRVK